MNLRNLIETAVFRFYGDKEARQIKAEATKGLAPMDWDALYNQMYGVPGEDEVKAPNEEHVRMYDKDIKELQAIKEELETQVRAEIPEYEFLYFFDTGIRFHSHQDPVHTIWSADGKLDITFGEKLAFAKTFLCEGKTELDMAEFLSFASSTVYESIEEDNTRVRIAQKGKTGEEYFSRILRGYKHKYHTLENIVIPAAIGDGLTSETDAYIITSKGVFVCEVKNYGKEGQTLAVRSDDKWFMLESDTGRLIGTKMSATEQNQRHCRATKAFFERHFGNVNIPIIPVVVIANDGVEINNQSTNPVIYAKDIEKFIESYEDCLSVDMQKNIIKAFEENKLDMVDYPVKLNKSRAEHAKNIQETVLPYAKANVKIANGLFELKKKCNLISNLVAVLIGLVLFLAFKEEIGVAAVVVIAYAAASLCTSNITFICALAVMIGFPIWIFTQMPQVAVVVIVILAGAYFLSKRN